MNVVLAGFVVVGFAFLIEFLDLPDYAQDVSRRAQDSVRVLRDSSLTDRQKEKRLQGQARKLFMLLGILIGGSLLALGAPLVVVWIVGWVGVGSLSAVLEVLTRLDFLIITFIVGIPGYLLLRYLFKV